MGEVGRTGPRPLSSRLRYWAHGPSRTGTGADGDRQRPTRGYLTFEPDPGGLNNVRMALECVSAIALLTGRALVLPPASPWYLINWGPIKREGAEADLTEFASIFHVPSLSDWVRVITTPQFIDEVGGERAIPACAGALRGGGERAVVDAARAQWFAWLRREAHAVTWNPLETVIYWPDIATVGAGLRMPDESFVDRRIPVEYDPVMAAADIVHFPVDLDAGYRMFGQAATLAAFDSARDEISLKRFLKYGVHYVPEVFDAAARVVDALGTFDYSALHIRRNDLQYRESWTGADAIVHSVDGVFRDQEQVYIASDETDPAFFESLERRYRVVRWQDFVDGAHADVLRGDDVPPQLVGCVEQLICAAGRVFVGTKNSTFSSYIHRLRGYVEAPDLNVYCHGDTPAVHDGDARPRPVRGKEFMREDPSLWQDADLTGDLYALLCTDNTPCVQWQCEVLEYTWQKVRQPGELIRLTALRDGEAAPPHLHARVLPMPDTNLDPGTGDHYPPFNRLYSLQTWLDQERPQGTVLLLDPDCVFRHRVAIEAAPGAPVAQHWVGFRLTPGSPWHNAVTRVSAVDTARLQAATWPAFIHTDDLRALLPRWTELTVALRRIMREQISDMIAFVVASAELGIRYRLGKLTAVLNYPEDAVRGAPLIHYCQPVVDRDGGVIWYKLDYRPWTPISVDPSRASLEYTRDLLAILRDAVAYKRRMLMHTDTTTADDRPDLLNVDLLIEGLDPVRLTCAPDDPALNALLSALERGEDSLMYVQHGDDNRVLYFRSSRLVAIEVEPL